MATDETSQLLMELVVLMQQHGTESQQVEDFIELHSYNEEFAKLAPISVALKLAIGINPKRAT